MLIQAEPLPQECQNCKEEDCYNCDLAGLRWHFSAESEKVIQQNLLAQAIKRRQSKNKRSLV